VSGRAYLSIGDVLTLLRQEFPDVTISKIRFLESQGLVNPERTPSGYRKFYEPDVERLRWVLRQQREHFLPLKVIKGRLEEVGEHGNGRSHPATAKATATGVVDPGRPTPATLPRSGPPAGEPLPGIGAPATSGPSRGRQSHEPRETGTPATALRARTAADVPAKAAGSAAVSTTHADRPGGRQRSSTPAPAQTPASAAGAPEASPPRSRPAEPPAVLAEGDMTKDELASASGCAPTTLVALESYGLISSRMVGGVAYFGEDALAVARTAAAFAEFGVEPRHLRLHKHAAEREAGFIEQVVMPLLKQRNPESRRRAHDTVAELSRLGQELRAVLLARALRDQLGG